MSTNQADTHKIQTVAIDSVSAQKSQGSPDSSNTSPWLDSHVVILNNYLRPHHVAAYRELAKRVRKLTILLSVAMEPDRDWQAEWANLDVRLQKNWTFTTRWKHSTGFREANFIHLPVDTASQLKQLAPDIVFSYEMGIRTLLAGWFRYWNREIPLVMVGNMSEFIEQERGFFRQQLRRIIRRAADGFTFNGPSCRRYLKRLGVADEQLFHLPYCIDANVIASESTVGGETDTTRLVYCGTISERKGIVAFTRHLRQWCQSNPQRNVNFSLAGNGLLAEQVIRQPIPNLNIETLGNCDVSRMKTVYGNADICVFPSLADEWGLVPIEAMKSGVPVLGSNLAQSVEACVINDVNGWTYNPLSEMETLDAIDRALTCPPTRLIEIGKRAATSVSHITASTTADCFVNIIRQLTTTARTT